ncbi:MAG: 4Fe-4S dicluster domain-containing protein [Candidatus Omnitrophica bacterium]|nr:4Fe-4S dicluster domain-containing protein [Candidatus Omnitrophota bacterium]
MIKYIAKKNLAELLDALKKDYRVFVPVKKGEQRFYKEYIDFTDDIVIDEVRAFEPLKAFFSRAREIVAEGFKDSIPHSNDKPFALVGVKACDLKAFKIQDHVFKDHDYQDPFYIKMREENLIISADCTCAIDTCFCLAVDVRPYPQENFDINLSRVNAGYIVEVGSAKGQALLEKYPSLFETAKQELVSEREAKRQAVAQEVESNIKQNEIPRQDLYKGVIEKKYGSVIWQDEAKTCVECGACNTICPTCHCFLLYDQKDEKRMARLRIWDSCMIKDFARVAGGANPRPHLWMRLRNRFEKKFDFFPKVAGIYACTGCGRCISACPGKIDIRKILKRLTTDAS